MPMALGIVLPLMFTFPFCKTTPRTALPSPPGPVKKSTKPAGNRRPCTRDYRGFWGGDLQILSQNCLPPQVPLGKRGDDLSPRFVTLPSQIFLQGGLWHSIQCLTQDFQASNPRIAIPVSVPQRSLPLRPRRIPRVAPLRRIRRCVPGPRGCGPFL